MNETPAAPRRRLPVRLFAGAAVVLLVVGGLIWKGVAQQMELRGPVRASGMIEMDETDVASLVGGRLVRLTVQEGDSVHAGDTLAVLDRGEIAADLATQQAQAMRAAAQARQVVTGPRAQEVLAARADRDAARSQRVLAERDLERARKLSESQVIAQADLDRAVSARDGAVARERSATERLRLLESGSRHEEIDAARQASVAARAQLAAARSRFGELVLTAPISGVVLLKNFELGELVQPNQPVVSLGDPDHLWLRVYVAAPRITEVVRGADVEVRLGKADARSYRGRVVEISTQAEFTPRAALTEEERADLVFGVKIALDPSAGRLKAGLPADALIATSRRSARD